MSDPVNMISPEGDVIAVPAEQVADNVRKSWRVENADESSARVSGQVKADRYGGVIGGTVATGLATLRGVTGGLTDVGARLIGAEDDVAGLREAHPYLSAAGEVLGTVSSAGVGGAASRLGQRLSTVAEGASLGTKVARGAAGYGAEGAILGIQPGVSELALSSDPLTAERVASVMSSSVMLGGGIGAAVGTVGRLAEGGLTRARAAIEEATAARTAVEGVPADLAHLDAKGLKVAASEERAAIRAEAETEKASLEELRKPQREELASQVRDMHQELMTERPIFQAVVGDDVRAISGVKDIASQLRNSYTGLRRTLDNSLKVAENPDSLIAHLQMRQTALESLQAKAPELRQALGSDARAAALDHVDDALAQTRDQIAAIKQVSKSNPVSGSRLTDLQAGVSPRLTAIEAAQDALTNAPKAGVLQKGAQGAAFAGVTALAHAIPGVGIMAPFAGKYASDLVGKAFEHLAGAGAAVAGQSRRAIDAFLSVSTKVPATAVVTATRALAAVRFGPSVESAGTDLASLYKARSSEIRNQTMYDPTGRVVMRPEARQAIAQRLAPIAQVNPILADKLETIAARKTEFISSMLPRRPDVGGLQIGPDNWQPSDLAMRSWARTVRAAEDPGSVEEDLARGVVTPEAAMAYRTVYPERFFAMQSAIFTAAPSLSKTLPLRRKVALSIFTGVPLIPALQPNILQVLQGNFATEPNSQGGTVAPSPQPSFGALGSLKSLDKPTPAQQGDQ